MLELKHIHKNFWDKSGARGNMCTSPVQTVPGSNRVCNASHFAAAEFERPTFSKTFDEAIAWTGYHQTAASDRLAVTIIRPTGLVLRGTNRAIRSQRKGASIGHAKNVISDRRNAFVDRRVRTCGVGTG